MQSDIALRRAYRVRVTEPLRTESRKIFARALARGEISPDVGADLVLDSLIGAVFIRLLFDLGPEQLANQRVQGELALRLPPAIDGRLADAGLVRHCLDTHPSPALRDEERGGRSQDPRAGALAAGPAGLFLMGIVRTAMAFKLPESRSKRYGQFRNVVQLKEV
jgi:Tetracyclin repressor-like, C-terminal domain